MRVVVLGGKGFLGSAIVREAQARGHEVSAIDRAGYADHVGTSCDLLINANGNSKKYLATQDPAAEFGLTVRSVGRALKDFEAARVVYLSSADVYNRVDDPSRNREDTDIEPSELSPYGLHKWLAERLVEQYAPSFRILRGNGFVGPGLKKNAVYDVLKGHPLRVHPDSGFQFLDSRTLARFVFDLDEQEAPPAILNLSARGLVSPRQVAAWAGTALDLEDPDVPRQRYELNLDQAARYLDLPSTEETVRGFVQRVREAKDTLA